MKKHPFMIGLCVLLLTAMAWAADGSDKDKDKDKDKNSVKKERAIEFGVEERIRTESWDDIMDYNDQIDDNHDHIRFRTRMWAKIPLTDNIEFYFGMNNESRKIWTPDTDFTWDEVIVENAYLDCKKLFGTGWGVKIGRQNIMRGEGFIIFDGNALDGSRTAYFNAVDIYYTYKKSKLELLGISDPYKDIYMFKLNNKNKPLTEWNEQALGVYYTDNNLPKTGIEAYYFYKSETHDYRPVTNPQYQPERRVNTLGGRVVQQVDKGWSLTGEFAGQWGGQHPDVDIAAWGGYAYVKKAFAHPWKPTAQFGYWAMSGDDPSTPGTNEGWDPLFSRWPKWSELYIYSQVKERGAAYWTNVGMWQAETTFSPWKPILVRATYYHLQAFHPFAGSPSIFGTGKSRGDMFQVRMDFKVNNSFKGHVLYESESPGDFYSAQNGGYFLRFEVTYTFKHMFPL
jgi:hypothetical protein